MCHWGFGNFMLANELFANTLPRLNTGILINKNLRRKLYWRFKVTSVRFFSSDFNWLSYELNNFIFKVLYWVIFYWCYIKAEKNYSTLTAPCEKFKVLTLQLCNFVATSTRSRFPVKLICCISFGSTSSACYLFKSIAISL